MARFCLIPVAMFVRLRTVHAEKDQCVDDGSGTCTADVFSSVIRPNASCASYPFSLGGFKFPLRDALSEQAQNAQVKTGKGRASRKTEPDRVNAADLSQDQFYETWVKTNTPVLVSRAAENIFKGFRDRQWTWDALLKSPNAKVELPVKKHHIRLVGPIDDHLNISQFYAQQDRTVHFQAINWDVLTGADRVFTGKGRNGGKKGAPPESHFNLGLHREYFSKVKFPNFLQKRTADVERGTFNFHLSVMGGAIPHSHKSTLNILFEGSKRWLLVNPLDYPDADSREVFEQIKTMAQQRVTGTDRAASIGYTSQDWYRDEAVELLEKYKLPFMEFIQHEGDALYIPDYWTHATMDLCRRTVGVEMMGYVMNRGWQAPETQHLSERGFRGA